MSRGRKKGNHDAKRIEIAEAACRVFLRRGLERTTLDDVAHELGNTTGVIRHYFRNKDELLLYAKNLVFDRSFERAAGAAARFEGLEKLRAFALELLPTSQELVDRYRLLAMFNGSAIGDARLMKLQEERNATHTRHLTNLIRTLQADGLLPKDMNASLEAAGIFALIDGLADRAVVRQTPSSAKDMAKLMNRYIDNLRPLPTVDARTQGPTRNAE